MYEVCTLNLQWHIGLPLYMFLKTNSKLLNAFKDIMQYIILTAVGGEIPDTEKDPLFLAGASTGTGKICDQRI